jgi:hypothetical protein
MEANIKLEVPKPLICEIAGSQVRASFDRGELQHYLDNTHDTILWVEDAQGNRAPMRVEFLRQTLV